MARSKQQRTPAPSRSTTTSTPLTAMSPVFSNKTSIQPTPDTSDIDEDAPKSVGRPKRVTRASSGNIIKKRATRSDNIIDADDDPSELSKKRRMVSRTVFVDIPLKARTKAKSKVGMVSYHFKRRSAN
jgi:hypothetical protein